MVTEILILGVDYDSYGEITSLLPGENKRLIDIGISSELSDDYIVDDIKEEAAKTIKLESDRLQTNSNIIDEQITLNQENSATKIQLGYRLLKRSNFSENQSYEHDCTDESNDPAYDSCISDYGTDYNSDDERMNSNFEDAELSDSIAEQPEGDQSEYSINFPVLRGEVSIEDSSATLLQSGYRAIKAKKIKTYSSNQESLKAPDKLQICPQLPEKRSKDAATKLETDDHKIETEESLFKAKKRENEKEIYETPPSMDNNELLCNNGLLSIKFTGIYILRELKYLFKMIDFHPLNPTLNRGESQIQNFLILRCM